MEKTRPILYGVADYAQIRKKNAFEECFSGTDIGADPTDEREAGGGFYDTALKPRLDRWPDIAHAALIEMKYVKAGDPVPTKEQLEKIKKQAVDQLDQYSADPALITEWHIGGRGATALPQVATGSDMSVASPKGPTFGEAALSPLHDGAAATSAVGWRASRPLPPAPSPSTGSFLCSMAASVCWAKRFSFSHQDKNKRR